MVLVNNNNTDLYFHMCFKVMVSYKVSLVFLTSILVLIITFALIVFPGLCLIYVFNPILPSPPLFILLVPNTVQNDTLVIILWIG